jgi:hypothetical protein
MRVKAKEMGFYNGSRMRPGVEFFLRQGDRPASWMVAVDDQPKVEKQKADQPKVEKQKAE